MAAGTDISKFFQCMMKEIKFTIPDISDLEIENVVEVLRSGWITTGPKTKLLEKKLAGFVGDYDGEGSPRCACLGSATAAMETALRLLGIGRQAGGSADDEVITCAYTYTASASVISHVGAKIVLVDCSDADGSIEMDYDRLEAAITPNTKAIIPVDIAGVPCDYDRISGIVERKKALFKASSRLQETLGRIAVVADGAHALGALRTRERWQAASLTSRHSRSTPRRTSPQLREEHSRGTTLKASRTMRSIARYSCSVFTDRARTLSQRTRQEDGSTTS